LPVVLFVFFSLVYSNELVRGIPIAILDEDHSELSLLLTRYAGSASSMKIVNYVNSMDELKSEFRKGSVRGAFTFQRTWKKMLNLVSKPMLLYLSIHQILLLVITC